MNIFYTRMGLAVDISQLEVIKKNAGIYSIADLKYEFKAMRPDKLSSNGPTTAVIHEDNLQFCAELYNLVKHFSAKVAIYKYPPNYFIGWHADTVRNTCINIPIESITNRFTVFRTSVEDKNDKNLLDSGYITRLDYELGYAFIMNTKMTHALYNLRDTESYMLTISIADPYGYADVVNYTNIKK